MIQDICHLKIKQEQLAEQLHTMNVNQSAKLCKLISRIVLLMTGFASLVLGIFSLIGCIVFASPMLASIMTIVYFALAFALFACLILQTMSSRFEDQQMQQIRTMALHWHFLASDYAYLIHNKS